MVVHSRMDEPQKADEFFQKADKLSPGSADLYADYGYACYLRGDLKQAETWLQKAHQIRPGLERITGNLALVIAAQGRDQESLTYYRQYLDEAEAQANVAFVQAQRGEFQKASERYAKALELNPKLKSAQHALLQIAEWQQAQKQGQAKNQRAERKPEALSQPAANPATPSGTASIRS